MHIALLSPQGVNDCHVLLRKIGEAYQIDLKSQMDIIAGTWFRSQLIETSPTDIATGVKRQQISEDLWRGLPAATEGEMTASPARSRPRAGTKNKILQVANEREEWLEKHNQIPKKIKTIKALGYAELTIQKWAPKLYENWDDKNYHWNDSDYIGDDLED